MAEPTWVLGFDGDCLTCRQLAEEVARLAGGRLEVRSLRAPEVAAWRARALGPDAPWAPTLLRIEGERVQAWTGRRLTLQLARLLGPGRALALAERLVGLSGAPRPATASVTRRGFLGKLGAAAFAFGLLASGKLALPAPARGAGKPAGSVPWWAVEPVKSESLDPTATVSLVAELRAEPDLPAVLGGAELRAVQGARHVLSDGRTLWAAAGIVGAETVVVAYADDAGRRAAFRYRIEGNTAVLVEASEGGRPSRPIPTGSDISPASCPPDSWPCSEERCCQLDLGAVLRCCAAGTFCAWPCRINNLVCISCLAIVCASCLARSCFWWCNCCWQELPWGP